MKTPRSIKPNSPTHKLSHGSKLSWNLYSGQKAVAVSIGVLGAVGVIFVVKFRKVLVWDASDRLLGAPKFWAVPGLQNLGNNCFLNVILQALSSGSGFRKYLLDIVEEYGSLPVEGEDNLPLVSSLTSLVEELCTVRHRRTVLSPRKVMLAMDHYIPNFNLTHQQDAEEAFSHLLSSLREEIAEQFVPEGSHLADLLSSRSGRIVTTNSNRKEETESQRWRRMFLGPLDGILGSIIICQSCSFQIVLEFELFHTLHLSPPINSDGVIMAGCTLEDCLKQFFVAEHLKNYRCSNCWHTAAIEYVSEYVEDRTDIEKLKHCNKNDPCDCKTLPSLEAFPWSNGFCRAFKQLSIAKSPKIFCFHLQRASYNMFGQSTKLQGHISFPSILDLSSFMNNEIVIKKLDSNSRSAQNRSSRDLGYSPHLMRQRMLFHPEFLNREALTGVSIPTETEVIKPQKRNGDITRNGLAEKAFEADQSLHSSRRSADDNMDVTSSSTASRHQRYRLISVVEHFGSGGGGHYTVYRRVKAKIGDEDPAALLESAVEQWFFISDSEVDSASEKDVLGANATMLFYERIDDS